MSKAIAVTAAGRAEVGRGIYRIITDDYAFTLRPEMLLALE